jgi:hypothetical protein
LPPGVDPGWVVDPARDEKSNDPLDPGELAVLGRKLQKDFQEKTKREKDRAKGDPDYKPLGKGKPYDILMVSGGGSLGAYPAGVLVGWSACPLPEGQGGRPKKFDVVTGISTGALIAPLAFLGPEYDCLLQREYTTVSNDDIFTRRRSIRALFTESIADTAPLRRRVEAIVTYDIIDKVAAAHREGRRLYIGTTNLDTKRLIVWDLGAIAVRGDRQLIIDVLLASAAIPAFFPSIRFVPTFIDGVEYEELHVDGGVTRALFFRPPYVEVPAGREEEFGPGFFAGSNMYMLVAGKIYADPEGVRARTLPVATASISNLLYALTRSDLYRLYTYSILTGMNYWVAAIPPEFPAPRDAAEFDRAEMTKLFNEGYRLGREGAAYKETGKKENGQPERTLDGTAWRDLPPGLRADEEPPPRAGLNLVVKPPPPKADLAPPPTAPVVPDDKPKEPPKGPPAAGPDSAPAPRVVPPPVK